MKRSQPGSLGRFAKTALLMIFLLIASAGAGVLISYLLVGESFNLQVREVLRPPFDGRSTVRILMLGEDNTGEYQSRERGLSDTIILASFDFDTKRVAALSIPRDMRVDLNGYGGMAKINAAHVTGGPTLAMQAVERLTGIKPDYYIKTNVEGFEDSVDVVGGVEIDVEKNMRYTDRRGGLYINLKKGTQVLDGDKAMQYVRFRHDALGDIARIQRQQKFLKALAKKALEPGNLPKLPQLMQALLKNVETDMTPKDALHLAKLVSSLDMSQVETDMFPGTPEYIDGISYLTPDTEKANEVIRKLFFPELIASLPRVEVLNGSGYVGAAQRVADVLKLQGYEVTGVGNADSYDYRSSEIICRSESVQDVSRIAALLNSDVVKKEYVTDPKADVTVIVGKDCSIAASGG